MSRRSRGPWRQRAPVRRREGALGELDTALYVELGRTVARGGPLAVAGPFFVSPLYVYLLAAIFAPGGSIATARALHAVLGSAAAGLAFLIARQRLGDRAAWVAGALAILTGLFTFYEILILPAALDPFLVALTLALVSGARAGDRPWLTAAAGVSAGLLALNRGESARSNGSRGSRSLPRTSHRDRRRPARVTVVGPRSDR